MAKSRTASTFDAIGTVALLGAVYALVQAYMSSSAEQTASGLGPVGAVNTLDNALIPQDFPGGGQVPSTSETYTGAATESVMHPVSTFESIFGINPPSPCPTGMSPQPPDGVCGTGLSGWSQPPNAYALWFRQHRAAMAA